MTNAIRHSLKFGKSQIYASSSLLERIYAHFQQDSGCIPHINLRAELPKVSVCIMERARGRERYQTAIVVCARGE